jgi:hypothetical protein
MNNQLSQQESLELIGKMINSAKNNLQKGTGEIFLLWGYLVAGISMANCLLLFLIQGEARYYSYYLWFLMAFGYPFHYILVKRREREMLVTTYIEKVMNWVWISFSISILIVVAGLITATVYQATLPAGEPNAEYTRWFHWLFMTPFMLCLYGFALFVSGKAYRFRPLVTGGIVCWAATLFLLAGIGSSNVLIQQQIVLCISVTAGYIIPGHLLNRKEQSHV